MKEAVVTQRQVQEITPLLRDVPVWGTLRKESPDIIYKSHQHVTFVEKAVDL